MNEMNSISNHSFGHGYWKFVRERKQGAEFTPAKKGKVIHEEPQDGTSGTSTIISPKNLNDNDLNLFLEKQTIPDERKYDLLQNPCIPNDTYTFKLDAINTKSTSKPFMRKV